MVFHQDGEEAEKVGLVNRVISLSIEEDNNIPVERTSITAVSTQSSKSSQEEQKQLKQREKQRANEFANILNTKLMDEWLSLAKEIASNGFTAVKTSKILINKGMDVDINTSWRKFMVWHYL